MDVSQYKQNLDRRNYNASIWRKLVNMDISSLKKILRSKEAQGYYDQNPKDKEVIELSVAMKKTPYIKWSDEMHDAAEYQTKRIIAIQNNPDQSKDLHSLKLLGHSLNNKEGSTKMDESKIQFIELWKKLFNMSISEMNKFQKWLDANPEYKPNVRVHINDLVASKKSQTATSILDVGIVVNYKNVLRLRQTDALNWSEADLKWAKDFQDLLEYYISTPSKIVKTTSVYRFKNLGVDFTKIYAAYLTETSHSEVYGLNSNKPLYIQSINVPEPLRKKGYGTNFLRFAEKECIEKNCDIIFGHIAQKSTPDIDFVKSWLHKNGYELSKENNDFSKVISKVKLEKGGMANTDNIKTSNNAFSVIEGYLQPFIQDLTDKSIAKAIEKGKPLTKFEISLMELYAKIDLIKAIGNYIKSSDTIQDVYLNTDKGVVVLNCTIDRESKKYPFKTELIYAGGYNIQRLHYRYLVKTDLPKLATNNEYVKLNEEAKKLTKIEKSIQFIKSENRIIEFNKQRIFESEQKTDDQIIQSIIASGKDEFFERVYHTDWEKAQKEYNPSFVEKGESHFNDFKKNVINQSIEMWKNQNIRWLKKNNIDRQKNIDKEKTKLKNMGFTEEDAFESGGLIQSKPKYVVQDEHTLGYLDDRLPNQVQILHASPLKGASNYGPLASYNSIGDSTKIRPATKEDFDSFRVMVPSDFYAAGGGILKQELNKGIEVEKEHSNTIKKISEHKITEEQAFKEIAKDHLIEDPHYYTKLNQMEESFAAGGGLKNIAQNREFTFLSDKPMQKGKVKESLLEKYAKDDSDGRQILSLAIDKIYDQIDWNRFEKVYTSILKNEPATPNLRAISEALQVAEATETDLNELSDEYKKRLISFGLNLKIEPTEFNSTPENYTDLKAAVEHYVNSDHVDSYKNLAIHKILVGYLDEILENPSKIEDLLKIQDEFKLSKKVAIDIFSSISEGAYGDKFLEAMEQVDATGFPKDLWSFIPDQFKQAKQLKKIDFAPSPKSENLGKIMNHFTGTDDLRPVMMGVHFDKENEAIVATNAHVLMSISEAPDVSVTSTCLMGKRKDLYLKNAVGTLEQNQDGCWSVNEFKYPNYMAIVPREYKYIYTTTTQTLKEFVNGCMKVAHQITKAVYFSVKHDDSDFVDVVGLNGMFLLETCNALEMLGHYKIDICLQEYFTNRALVIIPEGNSRKISFGTIKTDYALLMPVMVGDMFYPYTPVYDLASKKISSFSLIKEYYRRLSAGEDLDEIQVEPAPQIEVVEHVENQNDLPTENSKDLIAGLELLLENMSGPEKEELMQVIDGLKLLDTTQKFATGGVISNENTELAPMIIYHNRTNDNIDKETMETQFGKI